MRISDWSSDVCSSDLQTAQIASLRQQLADLDRAGEDLMPLMLRMTDSLEKFVALDLPFLHNERQARIDNLKQALGDPQVNAGEKFSRNQIGRASCRERVGQYV